MPAALTAPRSTDWLDAVPAGTTRTGDAETDLELVPHARARVAPSRRPRPDRHAGGRQPGTRRTAPPPGRHAPRLHAARLCHPERRLLATQVGTEPRGLLCLTQSGIGTSPGPNPSVTSSISPAWATCPNRPLFQTHRTRSAGRRVRPGDRHRANRPPGRRGPGRWWVVLPYRSEETLDLVGPSRRRVRESGGRSARGGRPKPAVPSRRLTPRCARRETPLVVSLTRHNI